MKELLLRFPLLASLLAVALPSRVDAQPAEPPYGLPVRTLWTTSRVVGSPDPPPPYCVQRAFPKLKFDQPLYLANEPDTDRIIVTQRDGKILAFINDQETAETELLLDCGREVYSLTFHPRYAENGYLFVLGNSAKAEKPTDRLSRYEVERGPARRVKPDSELVILEWETAGHNGGDLAFGPDGYLYLSAGDGTGGSDPKETGQDLADLLATMARIDVEGATREQPYRVPADNPFVGVAGARPEIWAYGLRNPWRFSFDRTTGRLWLGDIGQDQWEMIYLIERGGNYGWSVMEGRHPFYAERRRGPTPLVPPVVEHPHSEFRSIVGGFVYHGERFPELRGVYLYGDHETGRVWGFRYHLGGVTWQGELAGARIKFLAFGTDLAGDIYFADLIGGELYQLERAPAEPLKAKSDFPRKLSESGVFASVAEHTPAPWLVSYSVNSPLWSDGAYKERFLGLPGDSTIEFHADTAWVSPEGTVLVKTFSLQLEPGNAASRRRVETRFLTRQEGQWHGYSYLWNDEQTDATLVDAAGTNRDYAIADPAAPDGKRAQRWRFPSRAECMMCHSRAAQWVLGLTTPQMNRDHDYGGMVDNQLRAFSHAGLFKEKLSQPPGAYPRLTDPADATAAIEARARSYLHANCSHCHVTDGGGNARMELAFTTELAKANIVGVSPLHHAFGIAEAKLVAPGEPDRSLLLQRITRLGQGRMPPLATSVVDAQAAELIRAWIEQLPKAK
ncbi:MAG TPA: PQQ-dependent sugar dehydrogenase [Pirellulales bacterium]|nr:PQQ-dependent sugar dehydrogenase [Pirellulales bacterium]